MRPSAPDALTGTPLLPRRGEQLEIGVKYQPPGGSSYFSVAYYDLEENNLVDFVATGQTQPGLTITAQGVEVEALVRFGDISFDFDFQHQDAKEVAADGSSPPPPPPPPPRPSLPDTIVSLMDDVGTGDGFAAGLPARRRCAPCQPERKQRDSLPGGPMASRRRRTASSPTASPSFDALIAYRFAGGIEASLNVRNLADKQYFATCLSRGDCFPGEQRTILGSLAYRF